MTEFVPVVFYETDPVVITNRLVSRLEGILNKTIHPADIERLILQSAAYEIVLNNIAGNICANQMFAQYASAPILDYLAFNIGVERLGPSKAFCDVLFTLVTGHAQVVIPIGTRISSTDGQAVFATTDNVTVEVGVNTVSIECEALAEGTVGNGYAPNIITNILDPQAYILSASNTTTTEGGSEPESDDQLRARMKLAFNAFSTAGSIDAYKFYARSAHPSIIDVEVTNPVPGTVALYPLVSGGIVTPDPVLDAVLAACSPQTVRPLTDTVLAYSPTKIEYTLSIGLILYDWAIEADTLAASIKALTDYVNESAGKLGRDIILTKIISLAQVSGVYKVDTGAFADLIVSNTSFAICTDIEVIVTDFTNG